MLHCCNIDFQYFSMIEMFLFFFCFSRTDGQESPMLTEPADADSNSDKSRCKYGELVILGWVYIFAEADIKIYMLKAPSRFRMLSLILNDSFENKSSWLVRLINKRGKEIRAEQTFHNPQLNVMSLILILFPPFLNTTSPSSPWIQKKNHFVQNKSRPLIK